MPYNAFISYSHAADNKLAPAVQTALERFAKPWYKTRALRIYRDKTSLAITSSLWPAIKNALSDSEYFVLMASPEASLSQWVQQEVDFWLNHRPLNKLLIICTDGDILWDNSKNDFDWKKTTALPETLQGIMKHEPLWLDLRWARTENHLSTKHPKFRECIARIASTLHNKPLDDISGEEVRQHRKTMRIARAAITLLILLTTSAIVLAYVSESRRKEARKQQMISTSQALAAYAPREQEKGKNDELAALLSRQAYNFNNIYQSDRNDHVDNALRRVMSSPFFSNHLDVGIDNSVLTSFTVSREGEFIAIGGHDRAVRIWPLKNRDELPISLEQPYGIIWSLAFSPKSNLLSAGTEDGKVLLWGYKDTGEVDSLKVLESEGIKRITAVDFSIDGQFLAASSLDGSIKIWDITQKDNDPLTLTINRTQNQPIRALAFHPLSSNIIAAGGDDNTLRIWNIDQPDAPFRIIRNHDNPISSISFRSNGRYIACGTSRSIDAPSMAEQVKADFDYSNLELGWVGGNIFIWDLQNDHDEPIKILEGHNESITSLSFSPDGDYLVSSGGGDKSIRRWRITESGMPFEELLGHKSFVTKALYSLDGSILISLDGKESSLWLWNMGPSLAAPINLTGHDGPVLSLTFSKDDSLLFSAGGTDGTIRRWNLAHPDKDPVVYEHDGIAEIVSYNPNNEMFAVGYYKEYENHIGIWNQDNFDKPIINLKGFKSSVKSLSYSSADNMLASAGKLDREIWIWNLENDSIPEVVIPSLPANVTALSLSQEGKTLAWGGEDGFVRIIKNYVTDSSTVVLKGHNKTVNDLVFSPDDQLLFSGSEDGTILMWDLIKVKKAPVILYKLSGSINSVDMDPSGKYVLSGSSDHKVRLHDLQNINSDPLVLSEYGGSVYSVAASANGKWIAAGGSDNSISVWPQTKILADLICDKVWRNLTQGEWDKYIGKDIDYECTCPDLPSGGIKDEK